MNIDLEKGDKVLFNNRKTPLKVTETSEKILVEGPKGGEYEIFEDNDTLLVAKPGNREYASYCKNLRKTGKWLREKDGWKHSKTGAQITIDQKNNGFWTLTSKKFEDDLDIPKYGFTNKEAALEEINKCISKNPEG